MKEKVSYIKIGGDIADEVWGDFGWAYTKGGNLYYLWWSGAWPDESTAYDQVKRSMWVSLIRDAMIHDWEIEFLTEDDYSAKVVTLQVYAP